MRLEVFYASETGTSLTFAKDLARRSSRRLGCESVTIANLSEVQLETWSRSDPPTTRVFLVSTTGDGEMPRTARKVWRALLRANLPGTIFSNLQFACFGLGDSSYNRFNAAAVKLTNRLKQLGAREVCASSAGDDSSDFGPEFSFDRWMNLKLWPALGWTVRVPSTDAELLAKTSASDLVIELLPQAEVPDARKGWAKTVAIQRLTPEAYGRSTYHIEIQGESLNGYLPGEAVVVRPTNHHQLSTARLVAFVTSNVDVSDIELERTTLRVPEIGFTGTLMDAMKTELNLLGTPRRAFFESVALFCADPEERDKMLELAGFHEETGEENVGSSAVQYAKYCWRERRTYIEVLEDFRSCRVPWRRLLAIVPLIPERLYSVASAPRVHGADRVHLCVGVLEYLTPFKRKKIGVCSSYLAGLTVDSGDPTTDRVRAYREPAAATQALLSPEVPTNVPLICVATGTGIAPIRSLLHHRGNPSDVRLFFGCRDVEADFYYGERDGWAGLAETFRPAFSRRAPEGGSTSYVHVHIAKEGEGIRRDIIEGDAVFIVAGSAKRMPGDVREVVQQLLMKRGDSEAEAKTRLRRLEAAGRWRVEAWS